MAKGPVVPDWMEAKIAQILLEGREKLGVEIPAKQVLAGLKKWLADNNRPEPAPSLRKVQLVLTKVRKNYPEPRDVDGPWSLAESVKYNIPLEANGDLLAIWKFCHITDRKLSIREAQWVARLRGAVPRGRLFYSAAKYAARERACQALGRQLDSVNLDAEEVFPSAWLLETAVILGFVPEWPVAEQLFPDKDRAVLPDKVKSALKHIFVFELDSLAEEDTLYWTTPHLGVVKKVLDADIRKMVEGKVGMEVFRKAVDLKKQLLRKKRAMSPTADTIFALWLQNISESKKWQQLPWDEHLKLIEELYELVTKASRTASRKVFPHKLWKPTKLLRRYGLDE